MKIHLTQSQIEAIQKLLSAHFEIAGTIPNPNVCYNAYMNIKEQTGIVKVTERDYQKAKQRLKDIHRGRTSKVRKR